MTFSQRYRLKAFIRANVQAKSVLAMLCLAVSLATLMLVLSLQAGTREQMALILEDTGNRNLTVSAGTIRALPNRGSGISVATTLTPGDHDALSAQAQHRSIRTAAISSATRSIEYRELVMSANVTGTQPAYFTLMHFQLAQGRLLDAMDEARFANVAVLGALVAQQLFGHGQEWVLAPSAIAGEYIRINGVPFQVVGILHPRGSTQIGLPLDDRVYIPLGTAMHQVLDVNYLNSIVVQAPNLEVMPQLREQLAVLLRQRHGVSNEMDADFTLLDATGALAAASRNQAFASSFFRSLALLMLTMAAVGLFAVNHLGVKTREHEFGLRRAVGATRSNILVLVLCETLVLGAGGAVLGLLLGLGVFKVLRFWTAWALQVDAWIIAQVALAAQLMSVAAALLPAMQAAARNPLQALNQK